MVDYVLTKLQGELSFLRNGEYWGVAFKDIGLCQTDLYPAVAAIYKDDSFAVRTPSAED